MKYILKTVLKGFEIFYKKIPITPYYLIYAKIMPLVLKFFVYYLRFCIYMFFLKKYHCWTSRAGSDYKKILLTKLTAATCCLFNIAIQFLS
ncbi:Uncharacterized protein dnm_015000 [Desulfonema magnum]|uniref:Uncharacterized protein n=1 Tax=Desulfonema magnum TaxID=45655 RepID=A0A975BGU7_9BACT|nr:Uncharacterized protein dnm_015000 [Desulfonema magnum]